MSRQYILGIVLLMLWPALLCTAGRAQTTTAQDYWVKYQHTSAKPPAFTIEYPSGWTVNTTRKATDKKLGELVFPGKILVAFETKADTDLLECGVNVYSLPPHVTGSQMQLPVLAVGSSSSVGMEVKKLHGQDYLSGTESPTVKGQKRTIWRSLFLGDNNCYMIYMDVPATIAKQQPACQQAYASMVQNFTAPDWPLKTTDKSATPDVIPITVVNNNNQDSLYISITQAGGKKYEKTVSPGASWLVNLTAGGYSGYWGVFTKHGVKPGTALDTVSDTVNASATWTFREGPAKNPKLIGWVRQITRAPSAADAVGAWLKYVQADPSFSLDMPGGWTVIGADQADKMASDAFTLTPQSKVSFEYGSKPNLLRASVSIYTASAKADVLALQALLAAQPSDGITAPPERTVKQLNGHDILLEESTTMTTFSWNSYLPINNTVYVISFQGPGTAAAPCAACYKQMTESFLTNSWQPIQPPAPVKPATPATKPPVTKTGTTPSK